MSNRSTAELWQHGHYNSSLSCKMLIYSMLKLGS